MDLMANQSVNHKKKIGIKTVKLFVLFELTSNFLKYKIKAKR